MTVQVKARPLFEPSIVRGAVVKSLKKLDPRIQLRNPVMFVVEVGALLTTGLWLQALFGTGEAQTSFIFAITVWLWFTVIFANFAEAMAEGRGKAQADNLRKARRDITAKKLLQPKYGASTTEVTSGDLRKGDVVLVEAGDFIPSDGEAIEGVASVDESAIMMLPNTAGRLQAWGTASGWWADGVESHMVFAPSAADTGVAQWVYDHKQAAGKWTDTLPGADALYIPLVTSEGPVGVLGVHPLQESRLFTPDQMHLLETFASQIALAVERARLVEEAQRGQG